MREAYCSRKAASQDGDASNAVKRRINHNSTSLSVWKSDKQTPSGTWDREKRQK